MLASSTRTRRRLSPVRQSHSRLIRLVLFILSLGLAQAQNYTPLYTGSSFNRSIDLGRPVGATAGEAGVSPVGGATYAIPILIPPGTNRVQPSVAVTYNSMGGNGVMGMGWSISGLSMISRVPQSIYQDGKAGSVELNSEDRFALDGVRLVAKSGGYGNDGTVYATESESFARITSYNAGGVNGTGWFKVEAKDGTIMEYGSEEDARRQSAYGSPALFWLLKKVRYPDGNYMEYVYTDPLAPKISEIRYTGNSAAGLAPYNKIQFNYIFRTDENVVYESDVFVMEKQLLSSITVTAEGQTARTYQFNYGFDNINSYLKEVVEKGSDGTQLNSTIFKYGDLPTELTSFGSSVYFNTSSKLLPGDFNGDGRSDFLELPVAYAANNLEYNKGFKIFKTTPSDFVQSINVQFPDNTTWKAAGKANTPSFYHFLSGDFTGDGADDVVITNVVAGSPNTFNTLRIYRIENDATSYSVIDVPTYPGFTRIHPSGKYVYPGDFNGDGVQDILTMLADGSGSYASHMYLGGISTSFGTLGLTGSYSLGTNVWPSADQVFVLDFNGDGKSDLMVVKDNQCEIFTFDGGSYQGRRLYNGNFPTKDHLIYLGDFNGDRKTDLLVRASLTNFNATWSRAFSTGTGFETGFFNFDKKPSITGSPTDDQFAIADFNQDGRTDIYVGWNFYQDGVNFSYANMDVYYSQGNTFHFVHQQSTSPLSLSLNGLLTFDLNGDGRADLVNRVNNHTNVDILSFRKGGKEHLLERVANGHGHVTEWSYKLLNEAGSFYSRNGLGSDPFYNVQLPMYAVSELRSQNGIGGHSTMQYGYEDAKIHKKGKGFLGFGKVKVSNLTMQTHSVTETQFNTYPMATAVQKTSTYLNQNGNLSLLSETTYNNAFVAYGNQYGSDKRYWHRVNSTSENNAFEGRWVNTNFNYDGDGNVTQSTVTNNVETVTTSNSNFGAYSTPVPALPGTVTVTRIRNGQSPYSVTTNYGYNGLGQLTTKTEFAGLAKSVETSYQYTSLGNAWKTTVTPSGMQARIVTTDYDSRGRYATGTTGPMGHTSSALYDPRWGKPTSETGIDSLTTSYEYDAFGRLKKVNMPEGYSVQTSYNWDFSGERVYYTHTQHPGKPDVKAWHDKLGREVRKETEGYQGQWIVQTQDYDSRGNAAFARLPYKSGEPEQTVTTSYDQYNRPTSIANSAFGTTSVGYSYGGGELTTTTTNPAGQVSRQVNDASGQTIRAEDPGGTLHYTYNSQGNLLTVQKDGVTLTSSQYDAYGRQTQLMDPNAGTTSYDYNALGELTTQTNAAGQTTTMLYDLLGRNTTRQGPEGTTSTEYYGNGSGASTGQLRKVTSFAGNVEEYFYDGYGRLSNSKETIDGTDHNTSYGYNTYGDLTSKNFPSGFGIVYEYDGNGYLSRIKNNGGGTLYTNNGLSSQGVNTSYSLGNGRNSTINHHFGLPTQYLTDGVQNLSLDWNYQTGNLNKRRDNVKDREENFDYDGLNRLTTASVVGLPAQSVNYGNLGNIDFKTDVGSYAYQGGRPHAVTSVSNPQTVVPNQPQNIGYTAFSQPATVSENGYELSYTYGADYHRIRSITKQNNSEINRRYYFGDYEKDLSGGTTRHLHYIGSPAGLVAIVVRENGGDTYHYTYTDHLGSILTVTNGGGAIEAEQSFDAWGRRRNPGSWVVLAPTAATGLPVWLYRGYTGHEQLDQFGLINMNGRLYDPALGRVLSPDNYVQDPFNSQNYNRYSYVLNNPLKYIDPSGDLIWVIPNIGWSRQGGLSIGISVGFGLPGGLSAQVGAGYNFKSNDLYGSASVTAAFNSVYVSAGTKSGLNAGYTAGLTLYSGFPISTNFFTVGANYSITNNSWSGNISSWQIDEYGWAFNPSVSAMILPEHATNLIRGQGFRNNNTVLSRFVDSGNYQGALDYFGFNGVYRKEKPEGGSYVKGKAYYGATHPITGEISFGDLAFKSYDDLYSVAIKEKYHSNRIKAGILPETSDLPGMKYFPEEAKGFRYAFRRSGLYPNTSIDNFQLSNSYNFQFSGNELIRNIKTNFIYKIPRKW